MKWKTWWTRSRLRTKIFCAFSALILTVLLITLWFSQLVISRQAQATLQQAVRMAVRNGVTLTTAQVTTNLTDTVKANVQAHSVGLLKGTTGLSYIKVHYFDANNPSTDVSNKSWGNTAGNIMRVSVEGYPLNPLMARFWSWKGAVDNSAMAMTVYAADVIEPMSTSVTPAIGPAP